MRFVEPSSMKPGDDLDGLLRAFFQNEMPHPWPVSPAPHSRNMLPARSAASGHPLMRSRFALAASVALLLLGSLFLPGRITPDLKPGFAPDGTPISSNDERHQMTKELKSKQLEKKNKTGFAVDDGVEFELPSLK